MKAFPLYCSLKVIVYIKLSFLSNKLTDTLVSSEEFTNFFFIRICAKIMIHKVIIKFFPLQV